jgi:hypothetical protein
MAAYRETDLIASLMSVGCEFAGDTYVNGSGWFTSDGQVFMLPLANAVNGVMVVDADVVDDIFVNRWLGMTPPLPIQRL